MAGSGAQTISDRAAEMESSVADCTTRHVEHRAQGGPGMSSFEPDTATSGGGADSTRPRFQLARRGYDRQQVDRYVMELIALIEQQHQRAERAERMLEQTRGELDDRGEQEVPSFVHLGVEAGKVLEQAGASAEAIITEAKARGRSVIEDAEGQAAEVVQEAEQRADEQARTVLAEARDATNLVWQEAQQERSLVEAETTRLQAFRQDMLEHLTDVQACLSELLADARGLAEPAAVAEPLPVHDDLFWTEAEQAEEPTAAADEESTAAAPADGGGRPDERTAPMRPDERTRGR